MVSENVEAFVCLGVVVHASNNNATLYHVPTCVVKRGNAKQMVDSIVTHSLRGETAFAEDFLGHTDRVLDDISFNTINGFVQAYFGTQANPVRSFCVN